ncbi:MAG TPA: AGE family epimerase/isomerase [Roseiflexaceae bacterium]|nr:AGE family epimerase/isomerase [Roseiflexaceae bacterium]
MQKLTAAQAYIRKAEIELREDILPFWMAHAIDHEQGGFYGSVSNNLTPDRAAPRGALLSARILWAYAAAYRRYRDPAYLRMADLAFEDLTTHFWDAQHGGLYWQIDAEGRVLDGRKYLFNQAFAIYALSEYALAGGPHARETALELFGGVEGCGRDLQGRGYFEACSRAWDPVGPARLSETDQHAEKTLNTHLHLMEAYTSLLKIWNHPAPRARLADLVGIMIELIIDPATGHARHYFDRNWNPQPSPVSFGHDIEISWLLTAAAAAVGDPALLARAEQVALRMAEATYQQGRDLDGGLFYEIDARGIIQDHKEWWPQAEAVVGFLNAYRISGQPHLLDAALDSWDFIEQHLIDRTYGEWFKHVTRAGAPSLDEPKISFWKCPYHNTRACLELIERLRPVAAY